MKKEDHDLKTLSILLIEDDLADVRTVNEALASNGKFHRVFVVPSGEKAFQFLRNQDEYQNKKEYPKPGIIFLDLNLPGMSGHEFLKKIKSQEELSVIPVIAVTTSGEANDVRECFKSYISGYFVKPLDFEEFVEAIFVICRYWCLGKLP